MMAMRSSLQGNKQYLILLFITSGWLTGFVTLLKRISEEVKFNSARIRQCSSLWMLKGFSAMDITRSWRMHHVIIMTCMRRVVSKISNVNFRCSLHSWPLPVSDCYQRYRLAVTMTRHFCEFVRSWRTVAIICYLCRSMVNLSINWLPLADFYRLIPLSTTR